MPLGAPSLLAPSPLDLPFLFEAGRILDRHASVVDALGALVSLAAERGGLAEGAVALVEEPGRPGGSPLVLRVASELAPGPAGRTIGMGDGLIGKVLETGQAREGRDQKGPWCAAPTLVHESVVAVLAFRVGPRSGEAGSRARAPAEPEGALGRVEALAVLLGEALTLRRLIAEGAGGSGTAFGRPGEAGLEEFHGPVGALGEVADLYSIRGGLQGRSAAMVEVRQLI